MITGGEETSATLTVTATNSEAGGASTSQTIALSVLDLTSVTISGSAQEGQTLTALEDVVLREIDGLCGDGITAAELAKARAQLRARLVYDATSVTDIAHQLGFFETIGSWRSYRDLQLRLDAVTVESVQATASKYLTPDNRTIGWFDPTPAA